MASFCKTANLMSLSDLNGLRLFNAATVEDLATLRLADDLEMDSDSCFSPRGDRLAGYGASTIHLWDLGAIRTALRSLRLDWDLPEGLAPPVDDPARLVASAELKAWLSEIGTTRPLTATPVGPRLTQRDLQSNALAIAEEKCQKLADSGNWQEAADAYDTLFAAGWPADNMRRFERALLYAWLGRNDALRKFCAAQFRADHQTFWPARCAYLTGEAVDDWGPALRAAEAAIAREPEQSFHWAELGAIQVRAGEFAQAEKSLQRFLDPQFNREHHVYGWFWMSLACLGADRPDEARRWLIKASNWLTAAEKGQPPAEGNGSCAGTWWFRLELRLIRREAEERLATCQPQRAPGVESGPEEKP
jgi:tetratricopeptide (TPR) repeat protein